MSVKNRKNDCANGGGGPRTQELMGAIERRRYGKTAKMQMYLFKAENYGIYS